jgi:hypothetical protein
VTGGVEGISLRFMVRALSLFKLLLVWAVAVIGHAGEKRVKVYRTFMPDAGPSAFAVVLGPELALCYDSLRGGVNQAWHGAVDLSPTLQAKINKPADIKGTVFYKETTVQPLRVDSALTVPERRFKGYTYEKDGVTFKFTLDGIEITESLHATEDGRGLERRWHVPDGVTLHFVTEPQAEAQVIVQGGAEVSQGTWKFIGAPGATLSMIIKPRNQGRR